MCSRKPSHCSNIRARLVVMVPTTPACTWWNCPEEYNSSGKLESTHPSRTSVKSDQVFFGVESVMRVNADSDTHDSLLIRAAATSTSGTLNDLTTDLIMANNNNRCELWNFESKEVHHFYFAWKQAVCKLWRLPYTTKTYLRTGLQSCQDRVVISSTAEHKTK